MSFGSRKAVCDMAVGRIRDMQDEGMSLREALSLVEEVYNE